MSAECCECLCFSFSPFERSADLETQDLTKPVSLSLLGLCVGGDTHVLSFFAFWFLEVIALFFSLK